MKKGKKVSTKELQVKVGLFFNMGNVLLKCSYCNGIFEDNSNIVHDRFETRFSKRDEKWATCCKERKFQYILPYFSLLESHENCY